MVVSKVEKALVVMNLTHDGDDWTCDTGVPESMYRIPYFLKPGTVKKWMEDNTTIKPQTTPKEQIPNAQKKAKPSKPSKSEKFEQLLAQERLIFALQIKLEAQIMHATDIIALEIATGPENVPFATRYAVGIIKSSFMRALDDDLVQPEIAMGIVQFLDQAKLEGRLDEGASQILEDASNSIDNFIAENEAPHSMHVGDDMLTTGALSPEARAFEIEISNTDNSVSTFGMMAIKYGISYLSGSNLWEDIMIVITMCRVIHKEAEVNGGKIVEAIIAYFTDGMDKAFQIFGVVIRTCLAFGLGSGPLAVLMNPIRKAVGASPIGEMVRTNKLGEQLGYNFRTSVTSGEILEKLTSAHAISDLWDNLPLVGGAAKSVWFDDGLKVALDIASGPNRRGPNGTLELTDMAGGLFRFIARSDSITNKVQTVARSIGHGGGKLAIQDYVDMVIKDNSRYRILNTIMFYTNVGITAVSAWRSVHLRSLAKNTRKEEAAARKARSDAENERKKAEAKEEAAALKAEKERKKAEEKADNEAANTPGGGHGGGPQNAQRGPHNGWMDDGVEYCGPPGNRKAKPGDILLDPGYQWRCTTLNGNNFSWKKVKIVTVPMQQGNVEDMVDNLLNDMDALPPAAGMDTAPRRKSSRRNSVDAVVDAFLVKRLAAQQLK